MRGFRPGLDGVRIVPRRGQGLVELVPKEVADLLKAGSPRQGIGQTLKLGEQNSGHLPPTSALAGRDHGRGL